MNPKLCAIMSVNFRIDNVWPFFTTVSKNFDTVSMVYTFSEINY